MQHLTWEQTKRENELSHFHTVESSTGIKTMEKRNQKCNEQDPEINKTGNTAEVATDRDFFSPV